MPGPVASSQSKAVTLEGESLFRSQGSEVTLLRYSSDHRVTFLCRRPGKGGRTEVWGQGASVLVTERLWAQGRVEGALEGGP